MTKARTLATALALASMGMAGMAAPVPAQAQTVRILTALTTQDLAEAMEAIGGQSRLNETPQGGGLSMTVRFASGLNAVAQFNCNNNTGCTGLHLIAYFPPGEVLTPQQALSRVLNFNWGRAAISAGLDDSGNMFVSRYIVLDGGVTPQNLVANLQVFEALASEFATM